MAEKKGNSKVVWIVLFSIITVLLCYLFTVVYFYFISPYNIAMKLGFWPFSNEQAIGQMYMDSVVQINYKAIDDHFEKVDVNVVGVNLKQDGVVIAPLSEFSTCSEDAEIKVFTNGGSAYNGKVVFQDKNRNLVLIKCENIDGSNKKIKIPFVGIGTLSDCSISTKVVLTSVGIKTRELTASVLGGVIEENSLSLSAPKDVDGAVGYDYTVSNGFVVETNNDAYFGGGAVFNRKGKLLGLSFGRLLETTLPEGQYFIQPVYGAKDYINKAASTTSGEYKNELVDAFCGFDVSEAMDMVNYWGVEMGRDTFYFDNTWNTITDDVTQFLSSGEKGFHLFKEFNYNENVIPQHAAITRVKVGSIEAKVEWRCDLIDTIFKAKKGDKVVLTYLEYGSASPKTLSFTV